MKKQSDPFAALDALLTKEAEPTGPEWFTVNDFATRYKYSRSSASAKLRELEMIGKVKSWRGRIIGKSGVTVKYRTK